MRRLRYVVALALLLPFTILVIVWGSSTSASAHGDLEDGSPGPGDSLEPGGEAVALRFSELADDGRALVAILDASDEPIAVGPAQTTSDGTTICARTAPLRPGVYTLEYSVTSNDGDLIRGPYSFEVVEGGEASDNELTAACSDLALDPPGQAQTLDEMGTGSFPTFLPYLLGGLLVIALGLVVRRVRADRAEESAGGQAHPEGAADPEL